MPRKYGVCNGMAEVEEVAGGGVWTRIWQAFSSSLDEGGKLEWSRAFLDGSFVPAKKGKKDRIDQGGQGDEADTGGGWERDSPGALHLPGQQGRGEAGPGDFGTGAGTAEEPQRLA